MRESDVSESVKWKLVKYLLCVSFGEVSEEGIVACGIKSLYPKLVFQANLMNTRFWWSTWGPHPFVRSFQGLERKATVCL